MSEESNIPKHWQVKTLSEIGRCVTGTTPPKNDSNNYGNDIPFVKPPQLFDKQISDAPERLSKKGADLARILPANSVLVTCIGNLGRTAINKIPVAFNQQINAIIPSEKIEGRYLFYQAQSHNFRKQLDELSSATTVAIVNKGKFETIKIVISPLSEQQAIVSKIEELLSDLENGKQQLQIAQQQLKIYRQSLLKWAFEGKLTTVRAGRDMSKKDGELPEGWKWVKLEDIASVGTGATPLKGQGKFYEGGNIPWITSGALNEEYVTEAKDYVTETALSETNLTVYPKNTLLLAMYGEGKTRGKCSELLMEACTNQAIASIHNLHKERIIKNYLKLFLQKNYNDIRMLSSGGVQPNLNLGIVKKTLIPLPTIEEQQHIIDESESKLTVCNKIEQIINQSLQQAETLRQSILKKAFEGRLILKT